MLPKVEPHYAEFKDWDLKPGVVYGPFKTRRQGNSLGINLLAPMRKHCTFNCVYCQCGWTREPVPTRPEDFAGYPTLDRIREETEVRFGELLAEGNIPDAIIVSGNGEPTLYPQLEEAVDIVTEKRDKFFARARTGVLTAGTELGRAAVRRAVDKLDERMVKVDAGTDEMHHKVDLPLVEFSLDRLEAWTKLLRDFIVQSCFIRGRIDNTGEKDVADWVKRVGRMKPKVVHMYSLDRTPPAPGLLKVDRASLDRIAARLRSETGIEAKVF